MRQLRRRCHLRSTVDDINPALPINYEEYTTIPIDNKEYTIIPIDVYHQP